MSETSTRGSLNVQYTQATVVQTPVAISAATSLESSRQRVVLTSHVHESVQLRFTPRTVQQSGCDAKTS
jgi:hypothetical protein